MQGGRCKQWPPCVTTGFPVVDDLANWRSPDRIRAAGRRCLPQRGHLVEARCGTHGIEYPSALGLIQRCQLGEPALETARFHNRLRTLAAGVRPPTLLMSS